MKPSRCGGTYATAGFFFARGRHGSLYVFVSGCAACDGADMQTQPAAGSLRVERLTIPP